MSISDEYERNVFLNYPYDRSHQAIVDSMIFAVLCCGFSPRSADEEFGGLNQRLERIVSLISDSKYGIHDLSASTEIAGDRPRLNMPFELGIFYGATKLGEEKHRSKQGFVFDEDFGKNHAALSDASGLDLQPHKRQTALVLVAIQRYFRDKVTHPIVGPAQLLSLFNQYSRDIPSFCAEFGLIPGNLSYAERRGLMTEWLERRAGANSSISTNQK